MRRILAFVVISGLSVIATGAQTKAPVTRADYGQWESIGAAGPRGGFSPDGQWLAYALSRSNRNNELRFLKIADGTTKVAAFGTQPSFSADSKWAAYSLGYSEAEQERMRTERRPIQNKLGLLNLSNGETSTLDGVQSFSFSADGTFLAMRRYPPTPAGEGRGGGGAAAPTPPTGTPGAGAGAAAADDEPTGATLIVRELASGKDTTFGNIGGVRLADRRTHASARADDQRRRQERQRRAPLRSEDNGACACSTPAPRTTSASPGVRRAPTWSCLASKTDEKRDRIDARRPWRGGSSAVRLKSASSSIQRRAAACRPVCAPSRSAGRRGPTTARWSSSASRSGKTSR